MGEDVTDVTPESEMLSRRLFLLAAPAFIAAERLDFGVPRRLILPSPLSETLRQRYASMAQVASTYADNPEDYFA